MQFKEKGTIEINQVAGGYFRWREYWGDFGSHTESRGFKTKEECEANLQKYLLEKGGN